VDREEGISLAELFSYTVPNLFQGISQQPDAQRDPTQGEIQINGYSSISEGLRKREPTQTLARISTTDLGDVFVHSVLRDSSEKYLVVISKTAIRVFDLAGAEYTVTAASGAYSYLSSVVSAKSDIRAVSIGDYTFISNVKALPGMDAALLAPQIARPATHEALVWVKAANYGQKYTVTLNGTTVDVTTATAAVIVAGSTVTEVKISAAEIAENIKTGLAGVSGVTIDRSGSVLHLKSSSAMTIKATDARANADITAITNSVQAFTELPTIAPEGYQVEVTGDPGNKWDGYFVEFKPRTGQGTFGEGAWNETVAPGAEYRIQAGTMPHVLVRKPDGTFHFGPMDGSTIATGVTLRKWGDRTCGDYNTAPDPSFIGKGIQDIFVFKNRLGILADEAVVLSRPGEFFDFFPETVTTTLASDPIDIRASGTRVSVLRYAVPFQDELILFSDQTQFRLSSGDTSLTAATAQLTTLTQFEIDTRCRPTQIGNGIVFAQVAGDWTKFREFSIRGNGTSITADAVELTQQVSAYVPGGVFRVTADDTSNSWYAISDRAGYLNRVYAQKFFLRTTGTGLERIQNSWSHWALSGADKILQVLAIQEVLYLLVQYGAEVWLERAPIADQTAESAAKPTPLLLDRWVSTTTDTPASIRVTAGSYDATTGVTTWTLPYTIKAKTQAWSAFSTANGGVLLGEATSGTSITARGDWSAKDIVFGEVYDFHYRFTRFKALRDIGGGKTAANSLRTQVRKALLRYHETGYFEAHVMAERRSTAVYKHSGVLLGSRNSVVGQDAWNYDTATESKRYLEGVFTIPVLSKGENAVVELHNASALPCKFSTCEWVGLITGKAKSMQ
jgi:hypothetical protein